MSDLIDLAEFGEDVNEHYCRIAVAGLQFYSYWRHDEILGKIRPAHGDRVQLVRRPDNEYDDNATEVWWHNGQYQLGHVPRDVAEYLAPIIDAGKHVRAYADSGGNGTAWSASLVLVGEGLKHWSDKDYDAWRYVQGLLHRGDIDKHDKIGRVRGAAWIEADKAHRSKRRKGIAKAFAPILLEELEAEMQAERLPPKPPEKARGATYKHWEDVPAGLRTRTAWLGAGFKVRPKVRKPFATIHYYAKGWRDYELFSIAQVERRPLPTAGRLAARVE